ncbi:hypothetical protein [Streptomyces sp. NBC_01483]|uniref:hypothetical protein n=1 Tax=Streptomyces sp. NBC_01483 TaxID=2903883 RepID=UPI002E353182|nr:hypothetical protein [Streptomyces sp. NBC_01483]
MQTPTSHAVRKAEIVSRAWAEACSMAGVGPDRGHRPPGELAAAALRAHGALSTRFGRSVPFTMAGPKGCGMQGLAAFLAVYAAQQEPQKPQGQQESQGQPQDAREFGAAT